MQHRESPVLVGPFPAERQSGGSGNGGKFVHGVFVRILRADRFAPVKLDGFAPETHSLRTSADQVDLHSTQIGVIAGPVEKLIQIKVRAQLAIDPAQQVEIEFGCHAEEIVVGSFDRRHVLLEVDSDQQTAAIAAHATDATKHRDRLTGQEVADRRAWKVNRGMGRSPPRTRQGEILRKIRADGQDLDSRIIAGQFASGLLQVFAGDVHGNVRRRIGQCVQEVSRFDAAAAPILDQHRAGADLRSHLGRKLVHKRQFRTSQIVLVQLADPIEQLRAALIVEVFARQTLGACSQPADRVTQKYARCFRGAPLIGNGKVHNRSSL